MGRSIFFAKYGPKGKLILLLAALQFFFNLASKVGSNEDEAKLVQVLSGADLLRKKSDAKARIRRQIYQTTKISQKVQIYQRIQDQNAPACAQTGGWRDGALDWPPVRRGLVPEVQA